ncbi:hypothetical protein CISG_06837 [Coccidioides immitis RMSCC 3703]|uniref:Uncharacterized protein n=1 Tax=Coccidioides immitis RMSCC 3703 TaxID=454286 RepID=A0A0J8R1A0_COCIT|nr:hypothetical protein CISG_06837 [Coccidioides immitis RMSCC 3703]
MPCNSLTVGWLRPALPSYILLWCALASSGREIVVGLALGRARTSWYLTPVADWLGCLYSSSPLDPYESIEESPRCILSSRRHACSPWLKASSTRGVVSAAVCFVTFHVLRRLSPSATPDAVLGEKYPALSFSRPQIPELKTNFSQHSRNASADNVPNTDKPAPELAKRYRRRSLGSLDNAALLNFAPSEFSPKVKSPLGSAESPLKSQTDSPQMPPSVVGNRLETPSRSSSLTPSQPAEVSQRANSSPLSKASKMNVDDSQKKPDGKSRDAPSDQTKFQSAAAKRLTEISKKGGKGKSRLRRALSFSSVAELRVASSPEVPEMTRKQQLDEELGAEQAAIAEKQEASGLGENIYTSQRHFFTGSTDNISVSSTASSASIMLRKMGKNVKRSTRSLVGLFRPKSLHNVSLETGREEPMVPQVSRVTVEAQREMPSAAITESPSGSRGIQRNSEDTTGSGRSAEQTDSVRSRKSILVEIRKGLRF